MGKPEDKSKPEDRKEYIKEKIRKYGENWREHIKGGVFKHKSPIIIKRERPQRTQTYKGGGLAGMRRFNRGGKV
tara:strand:+ start:54 stop:275 length:222 start_codon:yes stop_codon:yes gene_type:complete